MTRPPARLPADLTDGWPDDPDAAELARFAGDLLAARPRLPAIALDRIQVRMRREIGRVERRRRWRRRGAVALLVAIAGGGAWGWLATRPGGGGSGNGGGRAGPVEQPPAVREKFDVTLPPASPAPPDRPLIDLEKDGELFGREAKAAKN